jgi:hypothetical protein
MQEPILEHGKVVKHILRYLQGTKEEWIHYFGVQNKFNSEVIINGSCDFE